MSKTFMLFVSLGLTSMAWSQEEQFQYSIEGGAAFFSPTVPTQDYIRDDLQNYNSYYTENNILGSMTRFFGGVKIERRFWKDRLGISSGLRYSLYKSVIRKSERESASEYFYFLLNREGTTTNYLRVNELVQTSIF